MVSKSEQRRIVFQGLSTSDSIDWDIDTPEQFRFMAISWDVQKAKQIINNKPRIISKVPVAKAGVLAGVVGDNEDLTREDINLTIPIILAPIDVDGQKSLLPIDGWQRIKTAQKENIETLPAVALTEEEESKARLE